MSFVGSFAYTTGKTWGGTQVSPTSLQAASILGGIIGLDHILLRSPMTAFIKTIVNILTLGFWYWYDVIQTMGDMEFIKQYGYTFPIIGPVGLGAGIIGETKGKGAAPENTPNPWLFVAYMFSLILPFGISSFIAGDFEGGSAKFFLTFFFMTTVLGLLGTLYSLFFGIFNTQTLLTHGTDRFFPLNLFMKPYGSAEKLTPPELYVAEAFEQAKEAEKGLLAKLKRLFLLLLEKFKGIFGGIYNKIFGIVEKPILEAVVSVTEPVVETAQEIKNVAETAEEVKNVVAEGEAVVKQTGGALNALTNTAAILAAQQQQGGAADSASKALFLGAAALIFVGSISLTYFRYWSWGEERAKKEEQPKYSNKNDIPPENDQNDFPPGSRVL